MKKRPHRPGRKGKARKQGDCPQRQPWRGKTQKWVGLRLEETLERTGRQRSPAAAPAPPRVISESHRRILEQQALYARSLRK